MFHKLGVQLFTVRDYLKTPESAEDAFARLAELGYTEAHTAGNRFDAELFGELLAKYGISVIGTHYDLNKILNDPELTMAQRRMWHTTNIGIGGLPMPARTDLAQLKLFIDRYNKAAELYGREGFRLTYHNHQFEFVRIDGYKTIMDILCEELDPDNISFVLDTCWVAAGGADVIDWMDKLKGRIDILHLKDVCIRPENGYYIPGVTEVGNGNLPWDRIMSKAEEIGVRHYIVEQDGYWSDTPFDSLCMSAEFLRKYQNECARA